jgi:hypothetical protein
VPLPHRAVERRFGIDLELVHVDPAIEDLHDRLDQARVGGQPAERLAVGMRGEGRARGAVFLAPDLRALQLIEPPRFFAQDGRLVGREVIGKKEISRLAELGQLRVAQSHDGTPFPRA